MPFQPQFDGDFPSLGWEVVDWIENYLAKPDVPDFELMRLYQEQIDFLVEFYRLDPATGRRVYHRGVISRPRGWGKSPMAGMLCAAEGLGPVLFDGWDANGQPVGKPWSMVRTPTVQIAAVSEDQTKNTYDSLIEMLDSDYLYDDYPGLEPLGGFVNLPRGKITPISASATSVKGARAVFGVMDQTEVWYQRNGGHKLASTMRSNAGKVGGTTLETPNAFIPGENSVAEKSANTAAKASAGELREQGVLWDHREAPPDTDMSDEKSLIIGLRRAYGDASNHPDGCVIHDPPCPPGHMDIRRLAAEIWDGDKDPQVSRSDFLNQITHASDSWLSQPEVRSIVDRDKVVCDGDAIVLGFDGSRGRKRGNPDATALIGIRLEDRHIFEVRIWEKTPNDPQDWSPPVLEVVSTIRDCVKRYKSAEMSAG